MFAEAPSIYSSDGKYLGRLSADRYDSDSISNPYGQYGSKYSADSINNPYGRYGSRYSSDSVWSGTTSRRPVVSLWPAEPVRRPDPELQRAIINMQLPRFR
jgi:hypothetical protein